MKPVFIISSLGVLVFVGGCVLRPAGTREEEARLESAGQGYALPVEQRRLPELPPNPGWRDVLHRAFLANGDLEAAWFEWAAAFHRIDMSATWPNSNVQVGYERMFTRERMKAWDNTTLSAGFDPGMTLTLPNKTAKAGQQALNQARAAGLRFQAKKFEVQKQVLTAWLDYALMAEQIRIQRDNVALLKLLSDTAADRVRAGGPQQDLLKSQIAHRLADNEVAKMEAQLAGMRAMLNGMLGNRADAPLPPPAGLPESRPLPADDARLIAVAVDANPELGALARDVAARQDALELARLRYLPDISPMGAITGDVSKSIGAMIMLPTTFPMIKAAVRENEAMLRATQAMARQTRNDRAASFVAALYGLRNAERQTTLFAEVILPKAQQALASSRQAYAAGQISFIELIDSQRTLLDVRQMIAQARIEREKRLAELEALAGVDVETLGNDGKGMRTKGPGDQEAGDGERAKP